MLQPENLAKQTLVFPASISERPIILNTDRTTWCSSRKKVFVRDKTCRVFSVWLGYIVVVFYVSPSMKRTCYKSAVDTEPANNGGNLTSHARDDNCQYPPQSSKDIRERSRQANRVKEPPATAVMPQRVPLFLEAHSRAIASLCDMVYDSLPLRGIRECVKEKNALSCLDCAKSKDTCSCTFGTAAILFIMTCSVTHYL